MDLIPVQLERWWYTVKIRVSTFFWLRALKKETRRFEALFDLLAKHQGLCEEVKNAKAIIAKLNGKIEELKGEDALSPLFLRRCRAIDKTFRELNSQYRATSVKYLKILNQDESKEANN